MPRAAPRCSHCLTILLASSLAFHAAVAQQGSASIDVGVLSVRAVGEDAASALSLSPALRWQGARATAEAAGGWSRFAAGDWSAQGAASASLFTPTLGALRGELAASAGGSTHAGGLRTGTALAGLRLHAARAHGGAWIGGGAGSSSDGAVTRTLLQGDLGAWTQLGEALVVATLAPTRLGDSLRYADGDLALTSARGRLEGTLAAGLRVGDRVLTGTRRSWWTAAASWHFTERVAIAAAAGSYALDPAQGFPAGAYATLALRLTTHLPPQPAVRASGDSSGTRPVLAGTAPGAAAKGLSLEVVPGAAPATRVLRVGAAGAARVEIAGDFTDWQPVAMADSGGGVFSVELPLRPGLHQLNVRIDGGAWTVPRGATAVSDEFGSTVGVIEVRPMEEAPPGRGPPM